MLDRLRDLFRGRPCLIQGTGKLPEGMAQRVALGDALAGGTEVVLARVDGRLHAVDRVCPHEGGRINDGPLAEGRYLVCPLHSYKFDPRTGEAVGVVCRNARVFHLREKAGDCEIWI